MDLLSVVKSTKAVQSIPESSSNEMASLNSDAIFAAIEEKVKADPAKAKSINAVFLYKITKDGKVAKEWSKFEHRIEFGLSPKVQRLRKLIYYANSTPNKKTQSCF